MTANQQTEGRGVGVHPAPAPEPAFLTPPAPANTQTADRKAGAAKPGLIQRVSEALEGRLHREAPAPEQDDEGRYPLAAGAKVQKVPVPAGAAEGVGYCLVAQGIAMPAGGAAWLVSFDLSDDPTLDARPLRRAPIVLTSRRASRVRIVALIDEFGRVFSQDTAPGMPPARLPDVQFKRYADQEGRGCVDVAQDKARTLRACEFEERQGGIALVNARVGLGCEACDLSLCAAAAVAFLAFWQFPHEGGYSLAGVGVRDALAKLKGSDVYEAAQAVIDTADEAQGRPNLLVPGVVDYAAQTLREAGFDGVDPSSLGEAPATTSLARPGVPFWGGVVALPATGAAQAGQVAQHIAAMIGGALAASGIPGLTVLGAAPAGLTAEAQAPQVKLLRTTKYANAFYVAFDPEQANAEGARMFLEAEGLFNRLVGMQRAYGADKLQVMGARDAAELDLWCVDHALAAADPYLDGGPSHAKAAPQGASDLDVRLAFAQGCECLRLPYRLEYEFDYDAQSRTIGVEMGAMPVCVMPSMGWNGVTGAWEPLPDGVREGAASRYAAFSLMAVAAVGFWCCPDVEHVWVNARRGYGATRKIFTGAADGSRSEPFLILPGIGEISAPDEPECVLSAQFARDQLAALVADADGRARSQADPFEALAAVPHVFGFDAYGCLSAVRPLFSLASGPFAKEGAACEVELDRRLLPKDGQAVLAARRVCDLGIFEGAARKDEARRIMESFEGGDSLAAIAQARDACARTENPLMRSALMRVIEGIATDAIEAGSHDEAAETLDDIYGLQARMNEAAEAVGKRPREARRVLEGMVSDVELNGWFDDSKTRCFRYFDSYAARALYALRCADDLAGRDLALCADEYYLAHYRLSTLLGDDLDSAEDAIAHARRCVELAPGVAASHLRLARCYFSMFDYASEIEELKSALRIIWNPKDLGLALYWLAYAFAMTDKTDAAMACYQRCVAYDRSLAEVASAELSDFAKRTGCELKTFTEREAQLAMKGEGVDLDVYRENVDFLTKAAGIALEAGNKGLAYKLLGAAGMGAHDDALAPVLSSLEA